MKVGAFTIQCDYIDNEPSLVLKVLAGCIVTRAEMIHHKNEIAYIAIAEHFDDVPIDCQVPEYDIILSGTKGVNTKITWEKKGQA